VLFAILTGAGLIAIVISLVWIPRLPRAAALEAPAILVTDEAIDDIGEAARR